MEININNQKLQKIELLKESDNFKLFKVLDEKDNKYFSLKEIPIKNLNDIEINEIENEKNILFNIKSEYIIKYYDFYKDKNNFYILMEYFEGIDLKTFINNHKDKNELIEEKTIYKIILDICEGLKEIHANNLIHRDLKPSNILINKNNKIKIINFGFSEKCELNGKYDKAFEKAQYYIAPEVIKGEKNNNKIDIWALGCIIYELLTRKICFQAKSLSGLEKIILKKSHGKIDLTKYNSKWQDLIDLLLKIDDKERPDINEVYKYINNEFKELKIDNDIICMTSKKNIFHFLFS